ncbi:hypothetical protein [Arenibaculum pallidiluteum]|uniref:hypothetical protein n=1 Tax=Arenibaculum pallidiluteum TaxID=2812559 RepID=UPI001A96B385|nr:hypothetical protein [Arenibaculum pallidiluteum]
MAETDKPETPKIGDEQLARLRRGDTGDPANPGDPSPQSGPVEEHPAGLPDEIR